MEHLLALLQEQIKDKMPLDKIVDVFEAMCAVPMEEDMLLFETGIYDFTGKPQFYFSLTRQVPNEEDEYYQLRVEVLYPPDSENEMLCECVWNEDLTENLFDYIRRSAAFAYAKNKEYEDIEIHLDET